MFAIARLLLTYLVHSTLLLGSAALLRMALAHRRLALQEALLRAALLGGFLTASLQLGLGLRPLSGVLTLPETKAQSSVLRQSFDDEGKVRANSLWSDVKALSTPAMTTNVESRSSGATRRLTSITASIADWRRLWPHALIMFWTSLAVLGLVRLTVATRRLHALLHGRRPLMDDGIISRARIIASALGIRRPARMSISTKIDIPLVAGVVHPEVCLPARALRDLPSEEQLALCAHELAHVARRDPFWLLLARVIHALMPLQPLNRWTCRQLEDLAECLSDDLAVSTSVQPIRLARSLVDVASWTLPVNYEIPATAVGALRVRSRVAIRVERIMDLKRRLELPPRFMLPLAVAAVLATALVTPVVSGMDDSTPKKSEPSQSAASPEPAPKPAPPTDPPSPTVLPKPAAIPQKPVARSDAERELEKSTRRIEFRVQERETDLANIESEINALMSGIEPDQEKIERLSLELSETATRLAATDLGAESGVAWTSEQKAEARRKMAALERQIHETASRIRIPQEKIRALQTMAREIAEQAKPTEEELAELRRHAAEIAHDAQPSIREINRITHESMLQAREAMRLAEEELRRVRDEALQAREETLRARESLRQAREQALRIHEDLRRAHEEARRAADEANRHAASTPEDTQPSGE